MSGHQVVVQLYFRNEEDARTAAREIGEEGLSATVERPAIGDGWAVKVEGEPDSVLALRDRMTR